MGQKQVFCSGGGVQVQHFYTLLSPLKKGLFSLSLSRTFKIFAQGYEIFCFIFALFPDRCSS